MAELATIATVVSAVAGAAGSYVSAQGTLAAGKAAEQAAKYEAAQLDIKAKEEQAAAQRDMFDQRREKELTLSKLQSNAAASGFSATDPTALALQDEIEKYGTYKEQMAQYGGESRRTGIEAQAHGRRMEGQAAKIGSRSQAAATILGGVSTMASKFGGPKYAASGGGGEYYYGNS
jgi:hypothetical protein